MNRLCCEMLRGVARDFKAGKKRNSIPNVWDMGRKPLMGTPWESRYCVYSRVVYNCVGVLVKSFFVCIHICVSLWCSRRHEHCSGVDGVTLVLLSLLLWGPAPRGMVI